MIGTKDIDLQVDLETLPNRLGSLMDSIIALDAHSLLLVAQIPPTQQGALNARIEAYDAAIRALVKARADSGKHVVLVDMYTAFAQHPAFATKFLGDCTRALQVTNKLAATWYAALRPCFASVLRAIPRTRRPRLAAFVVHVTPLKQIGQLRDPRECCSSPSASSLRSPAWRRDHSLSHPRRVHPHG